jgi:hypothetical protein
MHREDGVYAKKGFIIENMMVVTYTRNYFQPWQKKIDSTPADLIYCF